MMGKCETAGGGGGAGTWQEKMLEDVWGGVE